MTNLTKTVGLYLMLACLLHSCQTESYENPSQQQANAELPKKILVDSNGADQDTLKSPLKAVSKAALFDRKIDFSVQDHQGVLHLFDGQKQQELRLPSDAIFSGNSKNQQYFSLRSYQGERPFDPNSFELEIRSVKNEVVGRQTIRAMGFEGDDQFIPLDNGLGFIHATFTSTGLLSIYERATAGEEFQLKMTVDRYPNHGSNFAFDEREKVIFITYYDRHSETSYVEKLDWEGQSIWRKTFPQTIIKKHLALAPGNQFLSFVSKKKDGEKTLHILDAKGESTFSGSVNRVGNYYSSFQESNGRLYLLSPSGAEHFYVVDVARSTWLNNQKSLGKNIRVSSLSMVDGQLYGIAYNRKKVMLEKGGFTLAPDQTFLISGEASGPFRLNQLPLEGLPEMIRSNNEWVIKATQDKQTQYFQF